MFGNFLEQFGLSFPLQTLDAQGGLFAASAPQPDGQNGMPLGGSAPGGAGTGLNIAGPVAHDPGPATPGQITPPKMTDPGQAGLPQQPAAPSPLASPLAPGAGSGFGQPQNQPDNPAPAAGVGNQFTNGKAGF